MIKTKLLSACAVVGLLALTGPLFESASASATSNGNFLIKAQNVQNPEKQSVAGVKANLKTGENNPGGDGETTPEPENPDLGEDVGFPAVYSIDCGPMTFKIDSVELSYGNLAKELFEAGKKDEVVKNPGDWKYLIHTQDFRTYKLGLPPDGVDAVVALSDSPTSTIGAKASGMKQENGICMIEDRRVEEALGNKFHYTKYSESNYREGRFIEEEGKLIPVIVEVKDGEVIAISRLLMSNGGNAAYTEAPSDTYPSYYMKTDDGKESITFRYKTVIDGLEYLYVENKADSSGRIQYQDKDKNLIKRKDAPSSVDWNSTGRITTLRYLDANNATKTLIVPSGVDPVFYYNQQTGQNWDGSYKKVSDFNIDAPFIP